MSKTPSDVDDIFGAASKPEVHKPLAGTRPEEARKEVRVKVKWPARVQLSNGRVVEMRVCDISEGGIGLAGEVGIPANSVLTCAVAVPGLNDPAITSTILGTIKTTHCTVRGLDLIYGGTWLHNDAPAQQLLKKWIRRLRS